jgi:fructose-bisphosphate aldolase class II
MVAYADSKGWKGGNYKSLNLPFENKIMSQPRKIRERMAKRVEDFVYNMIVNVFNGRDSALIAVEKMLDAGSYDPGAKIGRIEDPLEWTFEKIASRAASITSDKGAKGNFDD